MFSVKALRQESANSRELELSASHVRQGDESIPFEFLVP